MSWLTLQHKKSPKYTPKTGESYWPISGDFYWPVTEVQGTAVGLEFYSGLINAEMNDLIGEYGYLKFGYTDH
ncbi:MAG: hypothetical protein WBM02_08755 [bacterium]